MKKATYLIAFFLLSILSISAHTERVASAEEGMQAPMLSIITADGEVSIEQNHGRFTLLNFWKSSDAKSRISNIEFDRLAQRHSSELNLISINLDQSERLFNEIVANDCLSHEMQFHPDKMQMEQIVESYPDSEHTTSFLINSAGKIVAVNPEISTIEKTISRNGSNG